MNMETQTNWNNRTAALAAGIGLIAMAVIAGWSNFVAIEGLILDGDASATSENLSSSARLFKTGALGLFIVALLDILVAWALYGVFRRERPGLALLASWSRFGYAIAFIAVINELFKAVRAASIDAEMTMFYLQSFDTGWLTALILFGVHLGLTAYLLWRRDLFARITSVLLFLAAAGYVLDGFSALLSPGGSWEIALYTFIGEIVFIFWLLIRGGKNPEIGRPS